MMMINVIIHRLVSQCCFESPLFFSATCQRARPSGSIRAMFGLSKTRLFASTPLRLQMASFSVKGHSSDLHHKIQEANNEYLDRHSRADLYLEDIAPAKEVIPFLRDNPLSLVHAGPPIPWSNMCGAMKGSNGVLTKGAIAGMVMVEGWANNFDDAVRLMESGKVKIGSANENSAVGPMSGVITGSMPVWCVRNKTFGNTSYSRPADLHQQFGNYKNLDAIRRWQDTASHLRRGLASTGPIPLLPIMQQALEMGDELHNRVNAYTTLLVNELNFGMLNAGVKGDDLRRTLDFCLKNPNGARLTLGLAMACAHAILEPTKGIEHCTLVSCMARNGTEWGVRLSGLGDQWFKAPAPTCHKYFIFPGYTRDDFGNDMGDSVITETAGWGALIMPNSMALAYVVGATPTEAFAIAEENAKLCAQAHGPESLKIPAFAYQTAPVGIDIRRVVKFGRSPVINTGIAHKDPGHSVVARGLLNTPFSCFQQAADAYCKHYKVDPQEFLHSDIGTVASAI